MDGKHQIDPLYERAMAFMKNFKSTHKTSSISNVYVLRTIDRDGNVTCERYGMNLMTNYGMTRYFTNNDTFPTNLYIGNGSGSFNYSTNSLLSPIITTPASMPSGGNSKSYAYPLYYDSISGTISTIMKYMNVFFDYTISGITGMIEISEYGIGTAWTSLWTHSWVYNSLGQKSTIQKNINERLDITVYMCMTYPVSLITDAMAAGKYICITSQERFFNRQNNVTMVESALHTFKRNSYSSRNKTHTISSFVDNKYTITSNMGDFIISDTEDSLNGYIDGFISWNSGFNMFDRVLLPTPEAVDIVGKPTSIRDCTSVAGFSSNFGKDGSNIRFTQADITASYTADRTTGEYTCADAFLNDSSKWYGDQSFNTAFANTMYYTNNNALETIKLYRNMNPTDPIVAMSGGAVTLYATNEYWNTSSWTLITNMASIPQAVQSAKYWLTPESVQLKPVRSLPAFEFKTHDNVRGGQLSFDSVQTKFDYSTYDVANQSWFTIGGNIYVVSRGNVVVNTGSGVCIGYDKNVITYHGNQYKLTNLSQVVITPETLTLVSSMSSTYSHISESKTGYIIFQNRTNSSSKNAVKIDCRGQNGITQTQLSCIDSSCIYNNSTYYVCIDDTDPRLINVKALSNDAVYKSFSIPSNKAVPKIVFGIGNYVYATDCSTYGYSFDITGANDTQVETEGFPTITNAYDVKATAVDDMLIVYDKSAADLKGGVWCIETKNPTVIVNLNGVTYTPYGYIGGMNLNLFKINGNSYIIEYDNKDTNGNKDHRIHHFAIDLGRYLATGEMNYIYDNVDNERTYVKFGDEFMLYGNTMFHVGNLIPHRLVGTTRCVGSQYKRKSISNKSWTLEITNIATYEGKPPGNVQ